MSSILPWLRFRVDNRKHISIAIPWRAKIYRSIHGIRGSPVLFKKSKFCRAIYSTLDSKIILFKGLTIFQTSQVRTQYTECQLLRSNQRKIQLCKKKPFAIVTLEQRYSKYLKIFTVVKVPKNRTRNLISFCATKSILVQTILSCENCLLARRVKAGLSCSFFPTYASILPTFSNEPPLPLPLLPFPVMQR